MSPQIIWVSLCKQVIVHNLYLSIKYMLIVNLPLTEVQMSTINYKASFSFPAIVKWKSGNKQSGTNLENILSS